jgi:hypothetical protein
MARNGWGNARTAGCRCDVFEDHHDHAQRRSDELRLAHSPRSNDRIFRIVRGGTLGSAKLKAVGLFEVELSTRLDVRVINVAHPPRCGH